MRDAVLRQHGFGDSRPHRLPLTSRQEETHVVLELVHRFRQIPPIGGAVLLKPDVRGKEVEIPADVIVWIQEAEGIQLLGLLRLQLSVGIWGSWMRLLMPLNI